MWLPQPICAGDVAVGVASSAVAGAASLTDGASFMKECEKRDVLPCGVGLSPTDPDVSFVEV